MWKGGEGGAVDSFHTEEWGAAQACPWKTSSFAGGGQSPDLARLPLPGGARELCLDLPLGLPLSWRRRCQDLSEGLGESA